MEYFNNPPSEFPQFIQNDDIDSEEKIILPKIDDTPPDKEPKNENKEKPEITEKSPWWSKLLEVVGVIFIISLGILGSMTKDMKLSKSLIDLKIVVPLILVFAIIFVAILKFDQLFAWFFVKFHGIRKTKKKK